MKLLLLFAVIYGFYHSSCDFIKRSSFNQPDTIAIVKAINKRYSWTKANENKSKVIESDLEGVTSEGGVAKEFYLNDELIKIEVTYYGSMGKSTQEYFLQNGFLTFYYQSDSIRDKPIHITGSAIKRVEENKYYFHEGSMIRWINQDKSSVDLQSELFKQRESEILNSEVYEKKVTGNAIDN